MADLPPIPPKLYFSMGETCDLVGVGAHVLRYWEKEIGQPTPTRRSGRRYYRCADILVARRVSSLLADGMKLAGVARQLREESSPGAQSEGATRARDLAVHVTHELSEAIDTLKQVESGSS